MKGAGLSVGRKHRPVSSVHVLTQLFHAWVMRVSAPRLNQIGRASPEHALVVVCFNHANQSVDVGRVLFKYTQVMNGRLGGLSDLEMGIPQT